MTNTLIFDFDGTIADTMKLVKTISDIILPSLGKEKISTQDIEKLRAMTIPQGLKYLDVPVYKLPKLIIQARMLLKENINDLKPIEGMEDALKQLKDKGLNLGIITSNSKENVEIFLKNNDLGKYFDYVDAGAGAFNKSWRIKSVVKKRKINKKRCLYVGDEIRDIEAAQAADLKSVAVGWGANDLETLKTLKPKYTINSPKELLDIVK